MSRTGTMIVVVCASVLLVFAEDSSAQSRYGASARNRSISRPSVSPYSSLLRGSRYGYGYGTYGAGRYTDPMLAPFLRQNRSSASRLTDRERGKTGGSVTGGLVNPGLRRAQENRAARSGALNPTGIAPTGTGSVYMQYSHFYQTQNFQRQNNQRRRR